MTDFVPVARKSTPEIIADQLRARILDGTLAPGSQIGEAQMAEQLQVSRGPVREAMQRLIQEGLLEYIRNRGVFVICLDADDIADIYYARGVVECAAAHEVMDRHDPVAFAALQDLLERMADAAEHKDWPRLSEVDLRFHETMVRASGSMRLARMFDTLMAETRICLAGLEHAYPRPADIVEEHVAIYEALAGGRREETIERIDAHMVRGRRKLSRSTPAMQVATE